MIKEHDLANALRALSIDMVDAANSGHPGMPLGMADIIMVLFRDFLRFQSNNPKWPSRDRLILSAGHGSALLYSALFLSGYDYNIEDLKLFRKIHSKTPGHPEYNQELGIEITTGPLGQGIANAVGIAIAGKIRKLGHKVYAIVGDGCLMEGVSYEATSLAGHLGLSNLIVLFDNNNISIDGPTSLATSENIKLRFQAINWHVLEVDGHNYFDIKQTLAKAIESDKPVIIIATTKIGYGSIKENSAAAHGSPLGKDEVLRLKRTWGFSETPFVISAEIIASWRSFADKGPNDVISDQYQYQYPNDFFTNLKNTLSQRDCQSESTRKSSGIVIEAMMKENFPLLGGSADLAESTCTMSKFHKAINNEDFTGNYIHYGVREHAMAAIMNGIAADGHFKPYGSTFLVFSDYCRPAIRLAALMNLPVIYVMTHDSIAIGEDGPTHQPIEHLPALRAIPNLTVLRPCDAIETVEAWEIAINNSGPTMIVLSRQNLKQFRKSDTQNLSKQGAYILAIYGKKQKYNIIASGSEVELAMKVAKALDNQEIGSTVISMPSIGLSNNILLDSGINIVIEASTGSDLQYLYHPKGQFFGVQSFGASGSDEELKKYFSLTVDAILQRLK